jgi:transcriptional antiterminator RfaH
MHDAPSARSVFSKCSEINTVAPPKCDPELVYREPLVQAISYSNSFKNQGRLRRDSISKWSLIMSTQAVDHDPQWYVVHTNPKQEDRAYSNLRCWGVETLHPKLKTRRVNEFSGASTYVTKPLFPRYIFAKFDARKQLAKISFTRGVHHVVSFGGQPTPVEEDVIQIISSRIDDNGFVKLGDQLKPGDKVVIKAGPLRDFQGVFERELNDNERISVLLTTISYQGRVVVSRDVLERASG